MKQKYPIGRQSFKFVRNNDMVYVDKTGIIYDLVKNYSYVFLSRPRRFGKSLLLSTLQAYFEGSKELFEGLEIMQLEKEWKKHPVFHLELSRINPESGHSLVSALEEQFTEWENIYNIQNRNLEFAQRLSVLIKEAYRKSGQGVVVLIDEYDNPLINTLDNPDLHNKFRSLLKSIYSNLKALDQYIQFAMVTGVSRFSNTSIFSGFNNLKDITFNPGFSTLCGFTEEEIRRFLWPGVETLGEKLNCSSEEALRRLKEMYDGYHFSDGCPDLYNPFSLLNALDDSKIEDYWITSATPEFLIKKLKSYKISLSRLFSDTATEKTLAEKDTAFSSPVALFYQTGYLTIKSYDPETGRYRLGIPNLEVERGLFGDILQTYLGNEPQTESDMINNMSLALDNGKPEEFLIILKSFLAAIPGTINHRNMVELNFENTVYVLLMSMGKDVKAEHAVAAGRIDLLVSVKDFIYIIEFKFNSTPKKALEQIEAKDYSLPWSTDTRKLFKVGVNFSSKTRNITGWKIKED